MSTFFRALEQAEQDRARRHPTALSEPASERRPSRLRAAKGSNSSSYFSTTQSLILACTSRWGWSSPLRLHLSRRCSSFTEAF